MFLEDYKVAVKLTSTLRTGIHEYKFENPKGRRIQFGLGKANNGVTDWEIIKVDENSVSGFQQVGRDKVHFYAVLSDAITALQLEKSGEKDGYAILSISDQNTGAVTMKIGISYVSIANAKENLENESLDSSFEKPEKMRCRYGMGCFRKYL